ncbi:MAG: nucleotidyltransferase domain-containing protein [Patescibacteria group bacterium]
MLGFESLVQKTLYDKKWLKLIRQSNIFRFLPFVEFVCAAGSMAIGNVKPESDFDVIISVREGRMFTARFITILMLDMLGRRRKNLDHDSFEAADTLCLNHFISACSYRLSPPHDAYWHALYSCLVPVFGPEKKIKTFFAANDWIEGGVIYREDLRHGYKTDSSFKKISERILSGSLGDWFERKLKGVQVVRIKERLIPHAGYKPRIIVSDDELELHLDTRRIEEYEGSRI